MGGIVAAETVLALANDAPVPSSGADNDAVRQEREASSFMFPYIQGILAFDTPYLGISPGVVAHGAEGHYKTASKVYSTASEVAGAFGWGSKSDPNLANSQHTTRSKGSLPPAGDAGKATSAAAEAVTGISDDAAATPSWSRWGRYAMFAGAAGAVAAGGAALYSQRGNLSAGWSWVSSHLEFVGCLMRGEELKQRLAAIMKLNADRNIGFADMYTCLGRGANEASMTGTVLGKDRTFCSLPLAKSGSRPFWKRAVNEKAKDETVAHTSMFVPRENPGYYAMSEEAKELIISWVDKTWYESSDSDDEAQSTDGDEGLRESVVVDKKEAMSDKEDELRDSVLVNQGDTQPDGQESEKESENGHTDKKRRMESDHGVGEELNDSVMV